MSICASYHALSTGLLQNDGSAPGVQMAVYMYMHTVEGLFGLFGLTWTPKVCKIMAFMAVIMGLGLLFYILLEV